MNEDALVKALREKGLLNNSSVTFTPLEGGVSSDVQKVTDGEHAYVIKKALPKLQVEDEWYADVSRNEAERRFVEFLKPFLPDAVPHIVYSDENEGFFVMEYLDKSFQNWKQQMLAGHFNQSTAKITSKILAKIHLHSWNDRELQRNFDHPENFWSLRIEPYLVKTGERHPELKKTFYNEAERLTEHREALVHGDFSPKNIMVSPERVVILDHEVACFGDPAFDMAFFLNHLYLKMLVHYRNHDEIEDLTEVIWSSYFCEIGGHRKEQMEGRIARLLPMMMLARVDGKSPVEYLKEDEKQFIRDFVYQVLTGTQHSYADINRQWKSKLKS